jgi:hypothetical protein
MTRPANVDLAAGGFGLILGLTLYTLWRNRTQAAAWWEIAQPTTTPEAVAASIRNIRRRMGKAQ